MCTLVTVSKFMDSIIIFLSPKDAYIQFFINFNLKILKREYRFEKAKNNNP